MGHEDNGTRRHPSERVKTEFIRAIDNSVRHSKRSLLDVVTYVRDQNPAVKADPSLAAAFELLVKRIHNDVSIIRDQILSAFQIYESDGVIPPFGRPEEERQARG